MLAPGTGPSLLAHGLETTPLRAWCLPAGGLASPCNASTPACCLGRFIARSGCCTATPCTASLRLEDTSTGPTARLTLTLSPPSSSLRPSLSLSLSESASSYSSASEEEYPIGGDVGSSDCTSMSGVAVRLTLSRIGCSSSVSWTWTPNLGRFTPRVPLSSMDAPDAWFVLFAVSDTAYEVSLSSSPSTLAISSSSSSSSSMRTPRTWMEARPPVCVLVLPLARRDTVPRLRIDTVPRLRIDNRDVGCYGDSETEAVTATGAPSYAGIRPWERPWERPCPCRGSTPEEAAATEPTDFPAPAPSNTSFRITGVWSEINGAPAPPALLLLLPVATSDTPAFAACLVP